jgi:predicted LPLAT superfamily acyltransferase
VVADNWLLRRERGNRTVLQLMTWFSLSCGWRFGWLLLWPITAYFTTFSMAGRRASNAYLTAVLKRQPRWRDRYRHYFTFSSTVLDRPFFLTGGLLDYDIEVFGLEKFLEYWQRGKGCILLGAHLGSFEVLRAFAEGEKRLKVHALMLESERHSSDFFNNMNPEIAQKVIPIGALGAMLRVKEALDQGGVVGILADRIARGDRIVDADFFDKPAVFPAGPFVLAGLAGAPVMLCFGLYCGERRYELHFEPFADPLTLPRERRDQELKHWVKKFAARLEHHCRQRPFNWFNFYDFWGQRP